MNYQYILTDRVEGAEIITLNRPEKLNALSFGLAKDLDDELTRIETDDEVKAVILTGAGDRAFSAGADIHEMAGMSGEDLAERQEFRNQATWHLAVFPKPIIGAINGLAYGGTALYSSTFDIRIGCERTSFRFLAASYGRVNSSWSLAHDYRPAQGERAPLHRPRGQSRRSRAHRLAQLCGTVRRIARYGDWHGPNDRQKRCPHGPRA